MRQQLQQIRQTAMTILSHTGVVIRHPEALAAFRRLGARMDSERVYLTEEQVLPSAAAPVLASTIWPCCRTSPWGY